MRSLLKRPVLFAAPLALIAVMGACSSKTTSATPTATPTSGTSGTGGAIKSGLVVYFIPKDTQNPYEVIADQGGSAALTALG
ncbi:MAG: rhamnose transport system substrate-binding protein, partial [Actinomycetota bacterium]|nr:rhamnose transport system substrate-binding protein [Actinomycetota bacterium]